MKLCSSVDGVLESTRFAFRRLSAPSVSKYRVPSCKIYPTYFQLILTTLVFIYVPNSLKSTGKLIEN